MRLRIVMSTVLVTLLLPGVAGAAVPKSARAVAVTACERGAGDQGGAAVFEARMRTLPGTARMQLRYTLQVRTPDRNRFSALAAPGFGTWVGPSAGTTRYVYTKRVENLLAPGSYRVKVRFRWLSASGAIVRRAKVISTACRQPDPRPNLTVRSLGVQAGSADGRDRYVAFVRNTGRTTAGPSSLELTVAGTLLGSTPVDELAPGEGMLVSLEGPACAMGDTIEAEADADEAVDERNEDDNRLSRTCPPPSG
jgi:CARDB